MVSLPFLTTSFIVLLFTPLCSSLNSDGLSLLALKAAITADPDHVLDTWSEDDQDPCSWVGVMCTRRRVTGLILTRRGLSGYIPSEIGAVVTIRRISFSRNNFTNTIPSPLFNATSLVYLDLSHNSLSGPVPSGIKTLKNLTHLDLSSNFLNGSLPEGLSELNSLVGTLNLSYNRLSGEVPASYGNFPMMVSLDFRQNNLTGEIPQVGSLLNQGPTAFTGNPGLCGFPLEIPCPEAQNPSVSGDPQKSKSPQNPIVPVAHSEENEKNAREGAVTVILISGASVAVGVVSVFAWFVRKKGGILEGKTGKGKVGKEEESDEAQTGEFGVVDEGFELELEDLLRASAYVVRKSKGGIVYKVVVSRGSAVPPQVVAVRRLSESDCAWRFKEFKTEVNAIGKVCHPNIVRLRAYYYAHDEKLLISDFIPNGSLFNALHEGPSAALPPLSWASRLKIAQGTARGLMHIHECSPRKYVHGNIKSSKVLLDDDLQAHISGFGLARFVLATPKLTSSSSRKHNSNQVTGTTSAMGSKISAYTAPEVRSPGSKFTQKCDVYSFGIVLLEILTGLLPEAGPENDGKGLENLVRRVFWEERSMSEIVDSALLPEVQAKQQVVAAFHVALNCTEQDPELRPKMRTVCERFDSIKLQ